MAGIRRVTILLLAGLALAGCAPNASDPFQKSALNRHFERIRDHVDSAIAADSLPPSSEVPAYALGHVEIDGADYTLLNLARPTYNRGNLAEWGSRYDAATGKSSPTFSPARNARVHFKRTECRFLLQGKFPLSAGKQPLVCLPLDWIEQQIDLDEATYRCSDLHFSFAGDGNAVESNSRLPEHLPRVPGFYFITQNPSDLGKPFHIPGSDFQMRIDTWETREMFIDLQSGHMDSSPQFKLANLDALIDWLLAKWHYEQYEAAKKVPPSFIALDRPGLAREIQLERMLEHLQAARSADSQWNLPRGYLPVVTETLELHRRSTSRMSRPPMGSRFKLGVDAVWLSGSGGDEEHVIGETYRLTLRGNLTWQVLNDMTIGVGAGLLLGSPSCRIDYQLPIRIQGADAGFRLQFSSEFMPVREERYIGDQLFRAEGWTCDLGIGIRGRNKYHYQAKRGFYTGGELTLGFRFGNLGEFRSTENDALLVWGPDAIPVEFNPAQFWIRVRIIEYRF